MDEATLSQALRSFDPLWQTLTTIEQAQVLRLLIERIDYDGSAGKVAIHFHAAGLNGFQTLLAAKKVAQ